MQNNNNFQRPRNANITLAVNCYAEPSRYQFDENTFTDLINDLIEEHVFSKVSIPVYMKKSAIYESNGDRPPRGYVAIGYIQGFTDNGMMNISIYPKYVEFVNGIADPVVGVRGRIKNGEFVSILAFDIVSANSSQDDGI